MSDSDPLEFDCPLCSGVFEVEAQWLGQEVECPHCGGEVTLATEEEPAPAPELVEPTSEPEPTPPPPIEAPQVKPQPEPEPPQPRPPLTQQERAALKRRVNMILAIAGAVLLITTFLLLSWLTG